ncbi:D-malate degradation protein R [Agrobacterium sp. DSM 25558]|uniref:LysR family transcriptional regulator n=1 Tax=Agrobacterium sp. DSM 25558 TaxID=1907665 RepID=UPI0009724D86|nr:LysR family transcriptional regulator [Agrobacterium sp. DSM 25558]SCX28467.1 D-malate degradation protein R [Agrobacterium sp. DSM 25558]
MDRLSSLTAFLRSAESGSFTDAARQLGLTPSGVAKAIGRLEARIGVRLFHRNTRSISLTPEGEQFFGRSKKILEQLAAAEDELSQSLVKPHGRLRVSFPLSGMRSMPEMSRFMNQFPDVELDLDFSDRLVDIVEEGFDVAVRTGDIRDSTLMTRVLGSFGHNIVGTEAYFELHGLPTRPSDLRLHRCLYHRYPSTGRLSPWKLVDDDQTDFHVPAFATASTLEPLLHLTLEGTGISYLPSYLISTLIEEHRLVTVLDRFTNDIGKFRANTNRH